MGPSNPMLGYSNLQLRSSLANWSENERNKVDDRKGYGSHDRHTFKYRADLLDAAIARLVELEDQAEASALRSIEARNRATRAGA